MPSPPRNPRPDALGPPASCRPESPVSPDSDLSPPPPTRPNQHKSWHSRDYLPHLDIPGLTQSITFRLADSLPRAVLEALDAELAELTQLTPDALTLARHDHVLTLLDRGYGECHLSNPAVAELVENALLHFDGARYRLMAWCIMPNHVHVLIETVEGFPLSGVVHAWKSFTAVQANRLLQRQGAFWMREYYDRYVRDAAHFAAVKQYIEHNPMTAGLVSEPEQWRWSSAWHGRRNVGGVSP